MEWVSSNLTAAAAVAAVVVPTFIQISPLQINPWTSLAKYIGHALNRELIDKVDQMQKSLDEHILVDGERSAKQCRTRVLRFNDELIQGKKHTKEHFDDILDDITDYERYCNQHPMFKNHKACMAIENVKRTYLKCEEESSFL